ncbi:MAG: hypothetical protein EOP46_12910 [Sphingobacteriaceae bacterium]|nr:MAG: hypothetical protein EOP46_12910 [Sphingobacteriaceae bacterium]
MPKYTSTLIISLFCVTAFAQNNSYIKKGAYTAAPTITQPAVEKQNNKFLYGPIPYRTLQETIGETYLVLPMLDVFIEDGYRYLFAKNSNKNVSTKEGEGKFLKLISVNDKEGEFTDSAGNVYVSKIDDDNTFWNLAPVTDFENTRKLLLNKQLWLKTNQYTTGDPYNRKSLKKISNVRFTHVTVIDVLASFSNNAPIFLVFKTDKGDIGFENANVSGTNTDLDPEYWFNEKFFIENPQITYKLTPKLWEAVKAHDLQIGMPAIAAELIYGRPTKRNKTKTATTVTEQWVYGDGTDTWYVYITNGKVSSVSF